MNAFTYVGMATVGLAALAAIGWALLWLWAWWERR